MQYDNSGDVMTLKDFIEGLKNIVLRKIIMQEPISEVGNKVSDNEFRDKMDFVLAVYKDKGMEHSKQLMVGDAICILTAVCSVLDNIISKGMITDKKLIKDVNRLLDDIKR